MAKGIKSGGRKKGTPNRKTVARVAAADKAVKSGLTPLEYLLQVMRNPETDEKDRLEAAKAAAPYVHPKLSSVEHKGEGGGPLKAEITVRFV